MSLGKDFRKYLLEDDLKIYIFENRVNVVNYISIDHFDSNLVTVKHNKGFINIKGDKLVVTKLLSAELLVEGKIKSVELK